MTADTPDLPADIAPMSADTRDLVGATPRTDR
jgi:hypothetical protein